MSHVDAPFELHFDNEIVIEYIVAIYCMIVGVYCLLLGSRLARLTLFAATWPCVSILIYYAMMVNNVNDIASLVVSFVLGWMVAVAAGAVLPFGLLLGGWAVGIIFWTGWMTFFPNEAPMYGNYILLAVPTFFLGIPPAFFIGTPSLIVISPIVGAFLFMQGIETFIHQGWAVMYVWYRESNCVDSNLCYYAMIAPTAAAILAMLFQAAVFPWDRPEEPAFFLGPPLSVVETTQTRGTYVTTKTEEPVIVNNTSDHIIVMPGQNASTDTTVVGGVLAEESMVNGQPQYTQVVAPTADESAPMIHTENGTYPVDGVAVVDRGVTPHPHDGHVSVLYDENGHARIVNADEIEMEHHSIKNSQSDKYTYEYNAERSRSRLEPTEDEIIPRTSSEQPGLNNNNLYNGTGDVAMIEHVTSVRPTAADDHIVRADESTGAYAPAAQPQRRNSVGDLIRRFEAPQE